MAKRVKKRPGKVSFKKARNYQRPYNDSLYSGVPVIDRELATATNCDACVQLAILTFRREGKNVHRCAQHVNWIPK